MSNRVSFSSWGVAVTSKRFLTGAGLAAAFVLLLLAPAEARQENWFIFGQGGVTDRGYETRNRVQQNQPARRASLPRQAKPAPAAYQPPARFRRQVVAYSGPHGPGTIIVDTGTRHLYHVQAGGKATRYGVGVGRAGFEWSGAANIARKAEWPGWRPPAAMIAREKKKGRILPSYMEGGPNNPLGARALYLYQGGRDTLYRIHGTNNPRSIGLAMSSGCIRMMNEDVIHLYEAVRIGAKVVVR